MKDILPKSSTASGKKIIKLVIALVVFIIITNPTLLPFLSQEAKDNVGNVWAGLFGDVNQVVSVFSVNWASLFKLIAMVLLLAVLAEIARLAISKIKPTTGKGKSIVTMLSSALNYVVVLGGIFWGLSIVGVSVSAIFAGVGVFALIIGFGAESLVADIVTGIFLVFEEQFNVGDIIEVGGFRGTVEIIGIRTTHIRGADGNVKIVNNSDIRNVLNRSATPSVSVVDIPIAYSENLENAEKVLNEILDGVYKTYPEIFLEKPAYAGVQALSDSSVNLRVTAKVKDANIFSGARILNREAKIGFDKAGIEIPFTQIVVHNADK